jgi:hypothetical protein
MKPIFSFLVLFLSVGTFAFANHHEASEDTYPLKTCVVSDEELGGMGDVVSYPHKAEGQADREVRFCCKMCIGSFKKDPASYLAKIDAAAAGHAHVTAHDATAAKACCAEGKGEACEAKED